MKISSRLFGCGKFRWLAIEKFDRELTENEARFFEKHRDVCYPCMRFELHGLNAMNLLTGSAMESEVASDFNERVLRAARLQRRPVSIAYWSPALAGAAVACLALIAALQMIIGSATLPDFNKPGSEASRRISIDDLDSLPELTIRSTAPPAR